MDGPGFIHLNCHSAFSLLEGALPIARLIELATEDRMPAVGVTDTANLFGALEFSEKAAAAGVQPIIGCKLPVRFEAEDPVAGARRNTGPDRVAALFLLSMSEDGYRALSRLVTGYYLNPAGRAEPLAVDQLAAGAAGLIALTGGHDGPLYPPAAGDEISLAEERAARLKAIFDDRLYISLERHDMDMERRAEAGVVGVAHALDVPLVATNEPFFPAPGDFDSHDALLAVADGRMAAEDDRRRLTSLHHFASRKTMLERFGDCPEALDSTVEIAKRCHYRPKIVAPILPRFVDGGAGTTDVPVADREAEELRRQAEAGLEVRLESAGPAKGFTLDAYRERLAFELDVIVGMNYAGYFLIVADFIKWAKMESIPVGPGRGSGAGSVVAWALTITDLDPLRFGLLFERFLNPDRVSMPDFDIDFCQDRRDEVIAYVQERYGADHVAQIITFGTLQARAVLRDVGRVLEMPYGQVDRLCKMVPADPANPVRLADAVADEPRFAEAREADPVVGRLIDFAVGLEGLYRHASTHAAGIVIGDRPLQELVPLYRDPRSELPVTQFNMKWVEQAGLVKFDFLGLKTLTVLRQAVDMLAARGVELDLEDLPLDDSKTYDMLARGETVGVFQLESQGMRRALVGMKADRFEDIIALVALYRPGPMDNIPTYNRRKHGEEAPDYPHPDLEPILRETYGVIIYQEQVMQIAQTLSDFSLGQADLLRRAMGKKIRAEMDAQRSDFVEGAVARGVKRADAVAVFDLVAKFASYGFNKSHAAAYALVAYQTAYLKANFPVEFLAASMSLDMANTDKLGEFRLEAKRLGISVVPPDINRSGVAFDVEGDSIVYALAALKGVGAGAVDHLVEVRDDRPFSDLSDFADRIDPRKLNRRTMECLVQAGAFDLLNADRASVFATINRIMTAGQERLGRVESGVGDLFAGPGDALLVRLQPAKPWGAQERLQREFSAVGAYLSAHPLEDYADEIARRGGASWVTFAARVRAGEIEAGRLAGTLIHKQERRTRNGGRIGILTLSDTSGQYEAVLYQEMLADVRDLLEPGRPLFMTVSGDFDPETDEVRVRIQALEPLRAETIGASSLRIFVDAPGPLDRIAEQLDRPGPGEVSLVLRIAGADGRPRREIREVEVRLPGGFHVTPDTLGAVRSVAGVTHVEAG